jgi:hypothetical protein
MMSLLLLLDLGFERVKLHASGVRGINRSRLCFDDAGGSGEWEQSFSNAALFANVTHRMLAETLERQPSARAYMWADMFNPFANGGIESYQTRYGGVEGPSACAQPVSRRAGRRVHSRTGDRSRCCPGPTSPGSSASSWRRRRVSTTPPG